MSEDTPWLSPAELYNWLHLTGALTALPNAIEQQLKRDSGLNFFEYSVLSGLSQAPGRAMKMSALAGSALGSQSRLSHAVTRLERAGWVQRRNCMQGARAVEAVLTDAGYAKIVEAAPAHVRQARRLVVDALTEQEFDQLRHALRKVLLAASPETVQLIDASLADGPEHPDAVSPCFLHRDRSTTDAVPETTTDADTATPDVSDPRDVSDPLGRGAAAVGQEPQESR